ncbi:hypothetical protein F5Y02DRAFT_86883 [Annulohypoxylon stygium]|nr:hypothetical protein F5Y02DRAFT_86883 [Annulohypoxylon stygium]
MKSDIDNFLSSLSIDEAKAHALAHEFCRSFQHLSTDSLDQFLPTPISESILRPTAGREKGRYLAIDMYATSQFKIIFRMIFTNTLQWWYQFESRLRRVTGKRN